MATNAAPTRQGLPELLTPLPGPKARSIIARDGRVVSPSFTRGYPLVAARGEGAIVEDVDGNRFLDFNAGIAVVAAGHCHPRVVSAIQEQAARLIHMSGTDFYYESLVRLAEKLAALAPGGGERRVYLGNSGTEAVEAAMKAARYHTGRPKFLAFLGGFHGRTLGSLSLTASKRVQRERFEPLLAGVVHAPYAYCYRCAYGRSPDTCAVECVKHIGETLFQTVLPPEEAAAIVLEPVAAVGADHAAVRPQQARRHRSAGHLARHDQPVDAPGLPEHAGDQQPDRRFDRTANPIAALGSRCNHRRRLEPRDRNRAPPTIARAGHTGASSARPTTLRHRAGPDRPHPGKPARVGSPGASLPPW